MHGFYIQEGGAAMLGAPWASAALRPAGADGLAAATNLAGTKGVFRAKVEPQESFIERCRRELGVLPMSGAGQRRGLKRMTCSGRAATAGKSVAGGLKEARQSVAAGVGRRDRSDFATWTQFDRDRGEISQAEPEDASAEGETANFPADARRGMAGEVLRPVESAGGRQADTMTASVDTVLGHVELGTTASRRTKTAGDVGVNSTIASKEPSSVVAADSGMAAAGPVTEKATRDTVGPAGAAAAPVFERPERASSSAPCWMQPAEPSYAASGLAPHEEWSVAAANEDAGGRQASGAVQGGIGCAVTPVMWPGDEHRAGVAGAGLDGSGPVGPAVPVEARSPEGRRTPVSCASAQQGDEPKGKRAAGAGIGAVQDGGWAHGERQEARNMALAGSVINSQLAGVSAGAHGVTAKTLGEGRDTYVDTLGVQGMQSENQDASASTAGSAGSHLWGGALSETAPVEATAQAALSSAANPMETGDGKAAPFGRMTATSVDRAGVTPAAGPAAATAGTARALEPVAGHAASAGAGSSAKYGARAEAGDTGLSAVASAAGIQAGPAGSALHAGAAMTPVGGAQARAAGVALPAGAGRVGHLEVVRAGAGASAADVAPSGQARLEVGVLDGTHGWLRIRAELAPGGAVNASLTASTVAHESLRAAVPEMARYLVSKAVKVGGIAVHRFGDGSEAKGDGSLPNTAGQSGAGDGAGRRAGAGRNQGSGTGTQQAGSEAVILSAAAARTQDKGNWLAGWSRGLPSWRFGTQGGISGSWLNVCA